jgi:hypothetical protein
MTPATAQRDFNADQRWEQIAARRFTIGGRVYFPRMKTGRLVKEVISMAPDYSDREKDKDGNPVLTRQEQLDNIDMLYRQAAMLLSDSDGASPKAVADGKDEDGNDVDDEGKTLDTTVDFTIVSEMVRELMPAGDDDSGKSQPQR